MVSEIEEFEVECIKTYQTSENINNVYRRTKLELEDFYLKWNQYLKQSSISDENVSL